MSQLLDHARDLMRTRHLSIRTEEAYLAWIKQYILFHQKQHPAKLGAKDVSAFLSYLAVERHLSASTQNQALSALLFLYREVLEQEIDWITDTIRARKPKRLPVGDVNTTMIYTHVLNRGGKGVKSPLDK